MNTVRRVSACNRFTVAPLYHGTAPNLSRRARRKWLIEFNSDQKKSPDWLNLKILKLGYRGLREATLIIVRRGEPPVVLFMKRAKIHSTLLYEFFEGGNIDTITTSPDKLVRRTNQATFSDLRKSGIHKAFGEFVVHTRDCSTTSSCFCLASAS